MAVAAASPPSRWHIRIDESIAPSFHLGIGHPQLFGLSSPSSGHLLPPPSSSVHHSGGPQEEEDEDELLAFLCSSSQQLKSSTAPKKSAPSSSSVQSLTRAWMSAELTLPSQEVGVEGRGGDGEGEACEFDVCRTHCRVAQTVLVFPSFEHTRESLDRYPPHVWLMLEPAQVVSLVHAAADAKDVSDSSSPPSLLDAYLCAVYHSAKGQLESMMLQVNIDEGVQPLLGSSPPPPLSAANHPWYSVPEIVMNVMVVPSITSPGKAGTTAGVKRVKRSNPSTTSAAAVATSQRIASFFSDVILWAATTNNTTSTSRVSVGLLMAPESVEEASHIFTSCCRHAREAKQSISASTNSVGYRHQSFSPPLREADHMNHTRAAPPPPPPSLVYVKKKPNACDYRALYAAVLHELLGDGPLDTEVVRHTYPSLYQLLEQASRLSMDAFGLCDNTNIDTGVPSPSASASYSVQVQHQRLMAALHPAHLDDTG